VGTLYSIQCTNGLGSCASGSSMTTASDAAVAGTPVHRSGGEIFSP
jgi:hypothetical protein